MPVIGSWTNVSALIAASPFWASRNKAVVKRHVFLPPALGSCVTWSARRATCARARGCSQSTLPCVIKHRPPHPWYRSCRDRRGWLAFDVGV
eukprot:763054-Rhodomonas_salina.2